MRYSIVLFPYITGTGAHSQPALAVWIHMQALLSHYWQEISYLYHYGDAIKITEPKCSDLTELTYKEL